MLHHAALAHLPAALILAAEVDVDGLVATTLHTGGHRWRTAIHLLVKGGLRTMSTTK